MIIRIHPQFHFSLGNSVNVSFQLIIETKHTSIYIYNDFFWLID